MLNNVDMTTSMYSYTLRDWQQYLLSEQSSPVHASVLMLHTFQHRHRKPALLDSLPKEIRRDLGVKFSPDVPLKILKEPISKYDLSVKFVLELRDGMQIETVLMPEKQRLTLCLSSQVGCAQGCVFCHTGRMGLLRNLTVEEIVGQVLVAEHWIQANESWREEVKSRGKNVGRYINNIVFMGMGEPLDNVENVAKAVDILSDQRAFAISRKRISISTAGHLDGLKKIMQLAPDVAIALSVHAVSEQKRSRIMPINRNWSLAEVWRYLQSVQNKSFLLQYTLIDSVNDGDADLEQFIKFFEQDRQRVKVNLIPFNEIAPARFVGPKLQRVEHWRKQLLAAKFRVMVRYSKGQDIDAACGQLVSVVSVP